MIPELISLADPDYPSDITGFLLDPEFSTRFNSMGKNTLLVQDSLYGIVAHEDPDMDLDICNMYDGTYYTRDHSYTQIYQIRTNERQRDYFSLVVELDGHYGMPSTADLGGGEIAGAVLMKRYRPKTEFDKKINLHLHEHHCVSEVFNLKRTIEPRFHI